jgi:regulator of RNase E activity RraA
MMATIPRSSTATKEQFQTLQNYTACDIADALLKLQVPNAGFLPDLHLFAPPHSSTKKEITVAPASTVIFAFKDGSNVSELPQANIPAGKHWVDLTQPETIVVMKQPEGQKCAILGGIMALRMKILNAKGVVVNGRVRDLVELKETGLPVSIFNLCSASLLLPAIQFYGFFSSSIFLKIWTVLLDASVFAKSLEQQLMKPSDMGKIDVHRRDRVGG